MPDAVAERPVSDQGRPAATPISPRAWFGGALSKLAASKPSAPGAALAAVAAAAAASAPAGDAEAAASGKLPAAAGKLPASKEGKVLHPDLINPNLTKTQ